MSTISFHRWFSLKMAPVRPSRHRAPAFSDKGLGGDVDTVSYEVSKSKVQAPSDMIMLADSKPGNGSNPKPTRGFFDANIDPTTPAEWPSNRHRRRTVLMFCDGHAESALRNDVIDPKNDNSLNGSWSISPTEANKPDP